MSTQPYPHRLEARTQVTSTGMCFTYTLLPPAYCGFPSSRISPCSREESTGVGKLDCQMTDEDETGVYPVLHENADGPQALSDCRGGERGHAGHLAWSGIYTIQSCFCLQHREERLQLNWVLEMVSGLYQVPDCLGMVQEGVNWPNALFLCIHTSRVFLLASMKVEVLDPLS